MPYVSDTSMNVSSLGKSSTLKVTALSGQHAEEHGVNLSTLSTACVHSPAGSHVCLLINSQPRQTCMAACSASSSPWWKRLTSEGHGDTCMHSS